MRVDGINKLYFVEVKKIDKGVTITCGDLDYNISGVVISKKNWDRIVKEIK